MSDGVMRNFNLFLLNISYGGFHEECSTVLRKLLEEIEQHRIDHGGKPSGEMTIKIKVINEGDFVEVIPNITAKGPKSVHSSSMFFMTEDHHLSKSDPRQMKMDLDSARERRAEREEAAG